MDELTPETLKYRFVCPSKVTDAIGNFMFESPYDRLHLVRNACAIDIPFANSDMKPNEIWTECYCGKHATVDAVTKTCTPYKRDFDDTTFESVIDVVRCIEPWTVRSSISDEEFAKIRVCGSESRSMFSTSSSSRSSVGVMDGPAYPSLTPVRAAVFDPSYYAMSEFVKESVNV